ncbi:MAG: hypothetical protein WC992_03765, partial [Acholeplasmataceae bacterium]
WYFDLFPITAGSDEWSEGPVYATYQAAVADIPNGTANLPWWSAWASAVGGPPLAGWLKYVAWEENEGNYFIDVTAAGVLYDVAVSGWSETPATATLQFRWDHYKLGDDRDWPEGFSVQVRIKSSIFSGDLTTAITEGALVGTFAVTNGGGDDESMALDATARAQISLDGTSYIGFFPVPTSAPAEYVEPPVPYVQTVAAISSARLALS